MTHPLYKLLLPLFLLLLVGANCRAASADVILVTAAKNPIEELDTRQVRNLYKGRLSSVNGRALKPVNAAPGSVDRTEFLKNMMNANELDYTGYWHVRRYSGQGTPPTEVSDQAELFERLIQEPDRVGYVWVPPGSTPKLPEGLKIIRVR